MLRKNIVFFPGIKRTVLMRNKKRREIAADSRKHSRMGAAEYISCDSLQWGKVTVHGENSFLPDLP